MMALNYAFFLLIVSSVVVAQEDGCHPIAVANIQLRNGILSWDDWEFETCEISYYIVNFHNLADGTEHAYLVNGKMLDLTFLPLCQRYQFMITPVSTDDVVGFPMPHTATTSPPPGADFTIQYLRLSQQPRSIFLEWGLLDEWQECAGLYRILSYNEDQDIPEDIYVRNPEINLLYLMPCTSYTFAVTAMYDLEQEGPPSVIRHQMVAYETPAPVLDRVIPHATSIEMTWSVENTFVRNRCAVTSINVSAAPYFTISFPIQEDPDNRRPFWITIPGLTPETMYYLNVSITNAAGVSPGSVVFVQTLDRD